MTVKAPTQTEKLAHITFLLGDDSISREQARDSLYKNITKVSSAKPSIERFDSTSEKILDYLERMLTPSLFQDTRIFHIAHVQNLTEKELDTLAKYLDFSIPDVYLIIECDDAVKSDLSFMKKLKIKTRGSKDPDKWKVFEFAKPPEYKIAPWLLELVPRVVNRTIAKDAADYLIELIGTDLDALYSEIQKIDIQLEPGVPIDKKVVQVICGNTRLKTVYELATALGAKDFTTALDIVSSLFSVNFYSPTMISAVYRHFWALFRIKKFEETNPNDIKQFLSPRANYQTQSDLGFIIGKAAGILHDGEQRKVYPMIVKSGIVQQSKNFTEQELFLIFKWLLKFDVGSKTGAVDVHEQSVQLLCFKICRVSQLLKDGIQA